MRQDEWKSLLQQWNKDILESRYREHLPEEVLAAGWLGFPGAKREEILAAEARLQTDLPSSYQEFLSVSNGWRMTTPFIDRVWGTDDIEWLAVKRKKMVENHRRQMRDLGQLDMLEGDYYVYGEPQDLLISPAHLESSLEVGFGDQLDLYLLIPEVRPIEGEWDACVLAPKSVISTRYRSFGELMLAEYERFLLLKDVE